MRSYFFSKICFIWKTLAWDLSEKTSLTPLLFIEVPVPTQKSGRSCICVLRVSFLPLFFSIRLVFVCVQWCPRHIVLCFYFVLCALYCRFLWIVHFWLSLLCSLTFNKTVLTVWYMCHMHVSGVPFVLLGHFYCSGKISFHNHETCEDTK